MMPFKCVHAHLIPNSKFEHIIEQDIIIYEPKIIDYVVCTELFAFTCGMAIINVFWFL